VNYTIGYYLSAKMARLFKGKRQQEEQNGTKKSSSAEKRNLKAKV